MINSLHVGFTSAMLGSCLSLPGFVLGFTKSQESKRIGMILVYNLLIKIRDMNKRTNLGNIYFENVYIRIISNIKAKTTSLKKKKGTNCGIYFFLRL